MKHLNYKYFLAMLLAVAGGIVTVAGVVSTFHGNFDATFVACIGAVMLAFGLQIIDTYDKED